MTSEEFDALLDEINAGHKKSLASIASKGKPSAHPNSLAGGADDDDFGKLPDDAKQAFADALSKQVKQFAENQKRVTDLLHQRHDGKITDPEMVAGINDEEKANKKFLGKLNEDMAAKLKQSGHDHPESQDLILAAYKKTSDISIEAWDKASKTILEYAKTPDLWEEFSKKYGELADQLKEDWPVPSPT
ncbi:hypothetical protein [Streptomyces noursei]|uniref:hypothetical protein n=1 Tax=Streptomyces noursei TaxID=1971 RepID=UPI0023B7CAA7|nr:hypothetical protein [Streptomyces noursei]